MEPGPHADSEPVTQAAGQHVRRGAGHESRHRSVGRAHDPQSGKFAEPSPGVSGECPDVAVDLFQNGSLAATVLGNVNGLEISRERLELG